MSDIKKINSIEKEKKLIEKIEKAKKELNQLRKNRIIECGELLANHHLEKIDNDILDKAFERLSKELKNGNKPEN